MNIKLNSLIKFFLVLLLLSSCEKDLYENQIKESTLKISHKQFCELLQVDAFNKSLNEVLKITEYQKSKENLALNGKTFMEENYGFTITGKPINVIENDTITSYTLFVTRDNNPLNVIENLVIQANNNNPSDIKAYLIKYTNDVNIYADFDMKDFQGTKTIVPIEYNVAENNPNNRIVYYDICFDVQSWYCYGSGHHPNSVGCIQGYAITTQECVTLSYNDGASSGGGGSSGGILTGPHGGGGAISVEQEVNQFNSIINSLSLNTQQKNWLNQPQNLNIKNDIVHFLQNNNSVENKQFVRDMINLSISNNSTFSFDNSINSSNSINVNNNADFQNYLNNFSNNVVEQLSSNMVGNTKIALFTKTVNFFTNFNVEVNQNINPYKVNNVSSNMSGNTLGLTYEQTTDGNFANVSSTGNIVSVTFNANLNFVLFTQGIGTIHTFHLTFVVKTNKSNGEPISIAINGLP